MARPLRIEFEGALYHVTCRGNAQSDIFYDDKDRQSFLILFSDVCRQMQWLCYGYCLMDNHYHLLIKTQLANLSKGMHLLNGVFTQRMNYKHERSGHLFQGRYKAVLVDAESHFLEVVRYVVLNPVRAGMVEDVSLWPWSSYRVTAGIDAKPYFHGLHEVSGYFSKQKRVAKRQFIDFVADGLGGASIWKSLNHQIYLGSDNFVSSVQQHIHGIEGKRDIPGQQWKAPVKTLEQISSSHKNRNAAIIEAYQTGVYSYARIADYFAMHFTSIGRIVRSNRLKCINDRPDPIMEKMRKIS